MKKDHREIRFGMIAVQKGFVTPDQIIDAMTIQISEDMDKGEHRLIGEILVGMGYITRSQQKELLKGLATESP